MVHIQHLHYLEQNLYTRALLYDRFLIQFLKQIMYNYHIIELNLQERSITNTNSQGIFLSASSISGTKLTINTSDDKNAPEM